MHGNPFLSAAPEPFLVRRAKRVRGIFSTLLTIFLDPTGWKLQCSHSSFYRGKAGACSVVACVPWESGEQRVLCTDSWRDGKGSELWPGHLMGDEHQNRPPRKLMASALCWWSLLVIVLLQPEYFVRVEKGISVLISLRLKGMGKLDKNMKTWNRNMLKIFQLNCSEQCLFWVIYWIV